jgi:hypothetical protein
MEQSGGNIVIPETWIGQVVSFFIERTKPIFAFINHTMESGWFGFAIMFMIFFTLFLIRMGAKTGKGIGVYADSLDYIGGRGLAVCGGFLALLGLEWALMPIWTVVSVATLNTITGAEPNLRQAVALLAEPSPHRTNFLNDVLAFYRDGGSVMPLGWRTVGLFAVCFGSMTLVGKAAGRWRSLPPA